MKHIMMLAAIVLLQAPLWGQGKVINVPADTSSIQAAINLARNGDTVLVAEGTYYENILIDSKSIVVASNYIVDGDTSHISRTIVNGSRPINTDRASVITVSGCRDTTTVVCGLTITGGFGTTVPNGAGGYCRVAAGINVERSSAMIAHNNVVANTINHTVAPGSFWEATAAGIGANTLDADSTVLVVRDNLIADNRLEATFSAGAGMAYLSDVAAVTANFIIERNTIRDNINRDLGTWKGMGGGLVVSVILPTSGTKIVRNNLITGNRVLGYRSFGGGVYFVYTDSPQGVIDDDIGELFYNNILAGNHADYRGGAVSLWRFVPSPGKLESWGRYRPRPVFINNTIVNNTAGDGSGFFIMNHVPLLMNNILWNQPQDSTEWGEAFLGDVPGWRDQNQYGSWHVRSSDVRGGWGGDTMGNIDSDPLLDSKYRLDSTSACIGAGTYSLLVGTTWYTAPQTCFDGSLRPNPSGSHPDIGACESPLPSPFTGIEDAVTGIPSAYVLEQNCPNPFNPSTTIEYELPTSAEVRLSVYDILGREVAVLANGRKAPGSYQATFNAAGIPSGVYLYRLMAGDYVQTRKMTVIK